MTETTHDGPDAGETGATLGEAQGDPLASARADLLNHVRTLREEAKADHVLDLDLPGYEGLLVARFRPFPIEKTEAKMNAMRKAVGKQPVMLRASCDDLIDACEQVMIRRPGQTEPEPIDPEAIPPIGFDARLAGLLGFQTTTARQVVLGVFPTEQAVVAMSMRVGAWMQDVTAEADAEALGN